MITQTSNSRAFYSTLRKQSGCPSIVCRNTGFGYYVETKDGKVSIEQVRNVANSWEAKTECVLKWIEQNK